MSEPGYINFCWISKASPDPERHHTQFSEGWKYTLHIETETRYAHFVSNSKDWLQRIANAYFWHELGIRIKWLSEGKDGDTWAKLADLASVSSIVDSAVGE